MAKRKIQWILGTVPENDEVKRKSFIRTFAEQIIEELILENEGQCFSPSSPQGRG